MKQSLLGRIMILSSLFLHLCFAGNENAAHAQRHSIAFDPVALSGYINKPVAEFTAVHGNGVCNVTYNGKNYQMTVQADSKGLLRSMDLIPENGTKNDAIDILTMGKDTSLPLGDFMGAKFSGTSGGIKKTIDETITLLQTGDSGLRIVSLFNPKSGVYFVIDYQNEGYKLFLVRNTLPLYIDELTAKVGTNFEQFYQDNFYISNKVSMFGMLSLYFDAVRNADNVNFTMNCEADTSKQNIKELSIYLNKNDNLDVDKSIELWEKEASAFLATFAGSPVKLYSTDVFGEVKQNFTSLDEAINFVTTNKRQDGVIISVEAGLNIANLVINKNNVYYLLKQNPSKPAITIGYALPLDSPLSFKLESASNIIVDWGDGVKADMGNKTMISGKLLGTAVKLYGDILTFDCNLTKAQSLDISGAPNMTEILCAGNSIDKLLLDYNKKMKSIDCENNKLTELNTSKLEKLEKLLCSENRLGSLDVSNNKKLKRLMAVNTGLVNLDVTSNVDLNVLNCSGNGIESLDLKENVNLYQLIAGNNKLAAIDVSQCALLERLILKNNVLSSANLVNNPNLKTIDISKNGLEELKLTTMNSLTECLLQNNKLTAINTKTMPSVMRLNAGCNMLPSLDVTANVKLRDLYIYGNVMNYGATRSISQQVYDRSGESVPGHVYVIGTNLSQDNQLDKTTATMFDGKDWEMYRVEEDVDGNLQGYLLSAGDFGDEPSGVDPVVGEKAHVVLQGNKLNSNVCMTGVSVYDFAGKLVCSIQQESSQYELQDLDQGSYVLVITYKGNARQVVKATLK